MRLNQDVFVPLEEMFSISDIHRPVAKELSEFNNFFQKLIASDLPEVNAITSEWFSYRGKQLRPVLTLLMAKLVGEVTQDTYVAASCVELIHSATLIHDDIVDNAPERRGQQTINAEYGNKVAVLVGDFILGRSITVCVDHKLFEVLGDISKTVKEMSEGEILQQSEATSHTAREEAYFDVIQKKTATLFATAATVGIRTATTSEEHIKIAHSFGEMLGIAFQLKDDILDCVLSLETGKKSGNDLREGKITLPMFLMLNQLAPDEQALWVQKVKSQSLSEEEIEKILLQMASSNVFPRAHEKLLTYIHQAKTSLNQIGGNEEVREVLLSYLDFIGERTL